MATTFIISLREFLEVFLIIGVFLGISKKTKIKREKEIIFASMCGVFISVLLPFMVFFFGDRVRYFITEKNADLLEAYLMIFSGCFIAYVVFSLHKIFTLKRPQLIQDFHHRLQKNIFDISLFLTIVFFIFREGFEIALFTATTALFTSFAENIIGLAAGLAVSFCIGSLGFLAYIRLPISRVFRVTEYLIVLLGAAYVKNGLEIIIFQYAHFNISGAVPIPLKFLPQTSTFLGHVLYNFAGLEQNFSLGMIAIMFFYAIAVRFLFLNKKTVSHI